LVNLFLRDATNLTLGSEEDTGRYSIQEDALSLLCEFDYPGNIRALKNFVFELTSYVIEHIPITTELVQSVVAKLRSQGNELVSRIPEVSNSPDVLSLQPKLNRITSEGDILLPLEVCVIREGETFKQWAARAKRCSIEATRQASGGTLKAAAERLNLSRDSLKNHLRRAKRTQDEALFEWKLDR
jgi:DNA-binding NtrC family response regulator